MNRSKRFASLLALCMILVLVIGQASIYAVSYTDIDGHWAKAENEKWSDKGLLQGNESKFNPKKDINRAKVAVILDRLTYYQETGKNTFLDYASIQPEYKGYVKASYNKGYTKVCLMVHLHLRNH